MKYFKTNCYILIVFLFAANTNAQIQQGHTNRNKFKQLYDQFATPNRYHNASGAPGVDYYQQKVDYKMDLELDDVSSKLYGEEVITYTNNSPDELSYLWLQLDQNIRKKDAPSLEKNSDSNSVTVRPVVLCLIMLKTLLMEVLTLNGLKTRMATHYLTR